MIDRSAAKAALSNLFVGDALSMPVHWYYNPGDIIRQFGFAGVQKMYAAPDQHPNSIMVLHSTKAGGRRAVEGHDARREVVGDIILKGKRHLWEKRGTHYHHGMDAGENTLNAWWARVLMQHLLAEDSYSVNSWVERYIQFMTSDPARHPDTYAESCHREFFANWAAGKDPLNCGALTHDTPSMGALVTLAPLVIALNRDNSVTDIKNLCRQHIELTHPDESLMRVVDAYVEMLISLLNQNCTPESVHSIFQSAIDATGRVNLKELVNQKRGDAAVVGGQYSLACYISDSWPSVCYLAAKYVEDPRKALIVNTNLGGENAHRGAVLGSLLGAASGDVVDDLFSQLAHHHELDALIESFLDRFIV